MTHATMCIDPKGQRSRLHHFDAFAHNLTSCRNAKTGMKVVRATTDILHQFQGQKVKVIRPLDAMTQNQPYLWNRKDGKSVNNETWNRGLWKAICGTEIVVGFRVRVGLGFGIVRVRVRVMVTVTCSLGQSTFFRNFSSANHFRHFTNYLDPSLRVHRDDSLSRISGRVKRLGVNPKSAPHFVVRCTARLGARPVTI